MNDTANTATVQGTTTGQTAPKGTSLLPPLMAIRQVWALTGLFTSAESSQDAAKRVDTRLKAIAAQAEKAEAQEKEYVFGAIACIEASIRSLDTAYKGRQLNFQENDKLREVYLESVQDGRNFGSKTQDYLKALPGTLIGGAGGMTFASQLAAGVSNTPGVPGASGQPVEEVSALLVWGITVGLAALGFLINALVLQLVRRRTQVLYVAQDYDRDLYYAHYIRRVELILQSLYDDLDRIHTNAFGKPYLLEKDRNGETVTGDAIVTKLLEGVRPSLCRFAHQHIRERKKMTPERWALCEAGDDAARAAGCPHWDKRN